MCNLCCPGPQKICWSCQAKRPADFSACKYCYSTPLEISKYLECPSSSPPPPPL